MNVTIHSATERVKLGVKLRDNPSCEILIKRKGKPIHYKSRGKVPMANTENVEV
jgi:hypothetical protein